MITKMVPIDMQIVTGYARKQNILFLVDVNQLKLREEHD